MVDRVKLFLTRTLITVQKLLVLSDTARTHVGGPKRLANAVDDDMADTKTCSYATCATIPNLVTLGQTVLA